MRLKNLLLIGAITLALLACQNEETNLDLVGPLSDEPIFLDLPAGISSNARKSKSENNLAVYMAEYITSGQSDEIGRTIFFSDRGNKQLAGDFVPALSLDGSPDISYYVDASRPSKDLSVELSTPAIQRAMATWDEITCSELGMTEVPYSKKNKTGFISDLFGFGGSAEYVADVTHCGWLQGDFFDILAPGGSEFILGVTFTIVFTDDAGNLVDTDNNGKYDVAWREIYYNDNFMWNDGATYDIETIALHEAGHGLSQAHFGEAFLSGGNFKLHFNPRAVMNAAYSGVQTEILQSDNAGHCSNWAEWPNH